MKIKQIIIGLAIGALIGFVPLVFAQNLRGGGSFWRMVSNQIRPSNNAWDIWSSNDLRVDGDIDLSNSTVSVALVAATNALNIDSNTLVVDASNDRVGIGTNAPSYTLSSVATGTSGYFGIGLNSSNQGSIFAIDGDGNVGIGTDSPTKEFDIRGRLYVEGNGTSATIHAKATGGYPALLGVGSSYGIKAQALGTAAYFQQTGSAGGNNSAPTVYIYSDIAIGGYSQTGAMLKVEDNSNSTGYLFELIKQSDTKMVVDTSGNVGINTTGPDRKLDVLDATNPQLRLTHTDGSVYVDFQTDSNGDLLISSSGNRTGFENSSPLATVDVNGSMRVGDSTTNYTSVSATGTMVFVGSAGVPFGAVYGNEIGWTQASAVQNTWYEISDIDIMAAPLHIVTHNGNGQLTVLKAGHYLASWSGSFEASAAGVHIQITFSINGTETASGINHFETVGANRQDSVAGGTILDLATNDTVEVSIRTTDSGTPDLSVDHLNISLIQIGGT